MSLRVIDNIHPESFFSTDELTNLQEHDNWVQCDECNKWRMLPPEADAENLPEKWFCPMNVLVKEHASCSFPEKDQTWYLDFFNKRQKTRQIEQLAKSNVWVKCAICQKMRMLPNGMSNIHGTNWNCGFNIHDIDHSTCAAPQRDLMWHTNHLLCMALKHSPVNGLTNDTTNTDRFALDDERRNILKKRDIILDRLVAEEDENNHKEAVSKKKESFISRFLFHDMLLIRRSSFISL